MELYSCLVRNGGSRENEVRKAEVTAADIAMLKYIHGHDAVVDIQHVGSIKRSDIEQREIMGLTYGTGEFDSSVSGAILVNQLFGPMGPLPHRIDGVEHKKGPKLVKDPNVVRATDVAPEEESADALID
jgi:hypothetical protein